MATQLQFYENVMPVSAERHADLYVKTGGDYAFAHKATAVLLTTAEFAHAAPEYSIVFAGPDDAPLPTVVLGAGEAENLFVDDAGTWTGRYVPAFVRRYPFVFANGPDGKTFTLCVDEDFNGCNRDGRGERLFDADGERTGYLQQVLNFQQAFQVEHRRTLAFCKKLVELELLEPVQAQIRSSSGDSRVLTGMRAVNRDKLKALDTETLAGLARSDELELVYLHLHSLNNLRVIGERLTSTADGAAPPLAGDAGNDATKPAATH